MRHLSESENKMRLELYEQGLSDCAIARKIKRDPSVVRLWRLKRKLASNYPRVGWAHPEHIAFLKRAFEAYRLRRKGLDDVQVAVALSVDVKGARRLIGVALMQLCRRDKACPYKALLPEHSLTSKEAQLQ